MQPYFYQLMKIIQSYWSKPSLDQTTDPNARFQGGWLEQKYAFYSQALSFFTFSNFYSEVELYTDLKGKELFVDLLEIPYHKVHVSLDVLNQYDSRLWALGKIFTYAQQKSPFIHADSDVFIWEKLPEKLTSQQIFTQNIEINFPAYEDAFNDILIHFDWIPTELINSLYKHKKICAFNAGIIGGTDLQYFKTLKEKSLQFIEHNSHIFEKIDVGIFNTIFEQQLGFAIAEKKDIPIHYYLDNVDSDFSKVVDFHTVPFLTQYVHCIGYAKKSIFACEQVEARLKYHFPEYYNHINDKLSNHFHIDFKSSFSSRRFGFLFEMYDWLENKTVNDIFNTSFKLHPDCKFSQEGDSYFIEYLIPQEDSRKKEILKDWNLILLYFEDSTTISELYEELNQDPYFLEQNDKQVFKNKLISFIMDKVLLLEILIIT